MWLYILERKAKVPEYDVMNKLVVRAGNEERARQMAAARAGDEGAQTWLDPELSWCDTVYTLGPEAYICISFNAG